MIEVYEKLLTIQFLRAQLDLIRDLRDMLFKMMSKIADLNGISKRGQISLQSLIDGIAEEIGKGRESR
ncbi:MAG: hypothetical protein IBX70_11945 [Clostridia bacterium]|nr:hypothetical protein [Clostridia bacterium]